MKDANVPNEQTAVSLLAAQPAAQLQCTTAASDVRFHVGNKTYDAR